MLDTFEILTTSGIVLWSRSNAEISSNLINNFINDVFIEEKLPPFSSQGNETSGHPYGPYKFEKYTLKWTMVKDLGLIFVAAYQSLLHLNWVDQLLEKIRSLFVQIFKDQVANSNAGIARYAFDEYYDQQLRQLEASTRNSIDDEPPGLAADKKEELQEGDTGGPPPPSSPPPPAVPGKSAVHWLAPTGNEGLAGETSVASLESSGPSISPSTHILTAKLGPGGRGSRRSRKLANVPSNPSSGDEARKGKQAKSTAKRMRKWDADGLADEANDLNLDYSANDVEETAESSLKLASGETVSQQSWGKRANNGQFILNDLHEEGSSIFQTMSAKNEKRSPPSTLVGSSFGALTGYFRSIVGGKTLTKEDLEKPLKAMEDHLIKKNVAREAAIRLCDGVEREMVGKKTGSFESVDKALRPALESSLTKILTPTSSLDLLQEIQSVTTPKVKTSSPRPYVISIVGVNGVGKSTNLAKICYFLLQNDYRVLIAACDTFRSGAVEQLNHHVRNLKELSVREKVGQVDIYQKGYGKDAANVAKDAVAHAASHDFNVVLIDTAGRRHNDTRLMSSLEKFANFAKPDKILMVGEALVGTDSVMQARNFNAAFGPGRNLDGFLISKCDTVGDMIGTLVSMVHATGIPVIFLGIGQHYGDLRNLSVPWAVDLLMS